MIAGKHACLRAGQGCKRPLDRQYHRYGFHCHSGRLASDPSQPNALPSAGKVIATVPVASTGGIAVGGDAVWVASNGPHAVARVDPQTNRVVATIQVSDPLPDPLHGPTGLAFSHGTLWVLDGSANCGCVHRIDPKTNRIVATIPLGVATNFRIAPLGIATTPDAIWVTNRWGSEDAPAGSVVRIDPTTNSIVAILPLGSSVEGGGPTGIAASSGEVWVGVPSTRSMVRIDALSNSLVATIPGFTCIEHQLVMDGGSIWVADCDSVRRVDRRTNAIVKTIAIPGITGSGVRGIAVAGGSVWVQAGPLVRIDPATGKVVGSLGLSPAYGWWAYDIASGHGSIWVRQIDSVVRVQPST